MKKGITSILTVWILVNVGLFSLLIISPEKEINVSAASIIVDDDGTPGVDCNFTTIQEAIDAANPGDTVFVKNGRYYENVVMNKIINLIGEDMNTTIIDGSSNGFVINVSNDWVNITGFTVTKSGYLPGPIGGAGIFLNNVQNCRIFDNIISKNNDIGIKLYSSNNNTIASNDCNGNSHTGFYLISSLQNNISNNNVLSNSQKGIRLESSNENYILNNIISSSYWEGILLSDSSKNNISGNTVINNKEGITLYESNECKMNGNNVSYNDDGFVIYNSKMNFVINNNASNNNRSGIYLSYSIGNIVNKNIMIEDSICMFGDLIEHWNTHEIDTSNMVNHKPIYYLKNQTNGVVPQNAGEIILANCSNILINNQELNNGTCGILLGFSSNNTINKNHICSNRLYGIYSSHSSNNYISNNNFSSNEQCGICFHYSTENNITSNNVSWNKVYGIYLRDSLKNEIYKNNIQNNLQVNIYLYTSSNNNTVSYNNVLNYGMGINLWLSSNNSIIYNVFSNTSYAISLGNFCNNITFHHNNFLNNQNQVVIGVSSSNIFWDDGYGEGNFWSDYYGIDNGNDGRIAGDGIGDTEIPHPFIDQGRGYYQLDNYPLMKPANVTAPLEIDQLRLTDSEGNEITNQLSIGEEIQIYAYGFNSSTNSIIKPISVNWTVTPDGTIDVLSGYSTNLTAGLDGGSITITGNTTTFSENLTLVILEPTLDYIEITDWLDGSEVDDVYLDVGDEITLYISGYNNTKGFIGLYVVDWYCVPNPIGTFSAPEGWVTTFTAGLTEDTATIIGANSTLNVSDSFMLSINAPTVDYIEIRNASSNQGIEVTMDAFTLGEEVTQTYFCAGYNDTAGYIGDVTAEWYLNTSIGTLIPNMGTFTLFTATTAGEGILSANVSGIIDSINIVVEPEVDTTSPEVPTGLSIDQGVDIGTLILSWNGNINADLAGYNIYRSISETSGFTKINSDLVTDISYSDHSLINGTTYYYYITAVDNASIPNESDPSVIVSQTTHSSPDAPTSLTTTSGDSFVILSWNAPSSDGGSQITNYRIYRGTLIGEEMFFKEIDNIFSYNDTDVINGVSYYYQITAKNAVGEGPLSNEINATPSTTPSSPVELTGLVVIWNRMGVCDSQINLLWKIPLSDGGSEITNYLIYRGTTSGNLIFHEEIENTSFYNDTSVTNGLTYYYQVSAKNIVGEGPKSNEVSAKPVTIPSMPTIISFSAGDSYVNLTWEAPSSDGGSFVSNYRIYRGTTSGELTFHIEIGNISFYNDTSVSNDLTYYYKISAKNTAGESTLSNEISVTPLTTSITPGKHSDEDFPWFFILIALLVVILIIIIIYFIIVKRKENQPPE